MRVTINDESTTTELTAALATWGLNAYYLYQIFAPDFAAVNARKC